MFSRVYSHSLSLDRTSEDSRLFARFDHSHHVFSHAHFTRTTFRSVTWSVPETDAASV